MKVLVVEDERTAANFVSRGLREEGYAVDVAERAGDANEAVAVGEYDAILLDVMIPGENGFELCKKWRRSGLTTPILFLTARDDVKDRIRGLDGGGDDYLAKPFSFEELLARLRAILRRSIGASRSELDIGDLHIDLASHTVARGARDILLTTREYQLLEYLALHAGEVVSRTRLWEHVWETGDEPDSNVIDVYIRYLRDKLGRDPDLIHTVRGSGYLFGLPRHAAEHDA